MEGKGILGRGSGYMKGFLRHRRGQEVEEDLPTRECLSDLGDLHQVKRRDLGGNEREKEKLHQLLEGMNQAEK